MQYAESRKLTEPGFRSLHEFLLNTAHNIHNPEREYLFEKEKGTWHGITYGRLLEFVDALTAWFMSQGLEKGDRVAIILENCPEYYYIDQSLQKLGLINVSIYPTLTPDETAFILTDSGAKILIVGNHFLLKKFRKVEFKCPEVFRVVSIPEDIEADGKFLTWSSVVAQGGSLYSGWKDRIAERFASVGHDDLATLIYTSGTTGVPKGAMLTHYNFMSNCYDAAELVPDINKDDLFMSFLPLSHVYERMATYYLGTYVGAQVAFAENIDKVAQNIGEMRPTIMACVPRLLEKVHDKVYKNATDTGGIKKAIFMWAVRTGEKVRKKTDAGKWVNPWLKLQHKLAHKLVYSKILEKMGGRMRLFVSGGGALPPHVGEFFANLGMKVQEGFGLTETSPFITVNEFNRQVYGTVGRVAPRQAVAIQDIETGRIITIQTSDSFDPAFESAEGEILAKGPNIMKGYWNNKAETDKVFDAEGWFHTGDIGRFDRGYLKITDRLKNMFCTSVGKNIYPTQVENNYLQSHKIEQIFLLGDMQEYVTAIIVPAREELQQAFGLNDSFFEEKDDFIRDEKMIHWVNEDVKKLSENLAKFERIKHFILKRRPFTQEDGEVTITLKVKRKVIMEKYADEIATLYPAATVG
ncbi:MAG: long-chain fatty acid--CoA ligase [Bacteroidetes bacterium]|nr:long-chain fatty acid--CoA ligase [Bacteroidota bacterium]